MVLLLLVDIFQYAATYGGGVSKVLLSVRLCLLATVKVVAALATSPRRPRISGPISRMVRFATVSEGCGRRGRRSLAHGTAVPIEIVGVGSPRVPVRPGRRSDGGALAAMMHTARILQGYSRTAHRGLLGHAVAMAGAAMTPL